VRDRGISRCRYLEADLRVGDRPTTMSVARRRDGTHAVGISDDRVSDPPEIVLDAARGSRQVPWGVAER
jgi:hypothetical protein